MSGILFRRPPAANGDLVFGRDGPPEGFTAHISASAALPPPQASAQAAIGYGVTLSATLPGPHAAARLSYRSEVSRPTVGKLREVFQQAASATGRAVDSAGPARHASHACRLRWQPAAPRANAWSTRWQSAQRASAANGSTFQQAMPANSRLDTRYQHAAGAHRRLSGGFDDAQRAAQRLASSYQDAQRHARRSTRNRAELAAHRACPLPTAAHLARPAGTQSRVRYQDAMPPRRGVRTVPVVPPWGCYTPPPGGAVHLLFKARSSASADILFTCGRGTPSGALIIPTLRAYIVVNSATLTRVSNNLRLPLRDISISGDADSVHWTWSATLPLRALVDLEPDAPGQLVELEARLNDMPWRLLVEKRTESERFGSGSLRISGRGIAAELSAPGAASTPRNNLLSAQTAQQLAADALTINGVSNGWTLTWQGADWLLPAGLWAHTGTPMEAVLRLAEAGGAYVLPAPAARSLAVLPRYPAAPWEWASLAPGVVLPAAATLERGSEEIVRPGPNIVFVCGRDLNARVRRAGSAGDRPAQMIVDPLTAHADAARQRGLAALAEASSHRMWQLETGILPGYGVIQIGTVLDWVRGSATRRGIVRGLAVAASLPSGASKDPVKVRQTLGVEIHG